MENPSARSFLNTVAIFYGSTAAFPFPTMSEHSEKMCFFWGVKFSPQAKGVVSCFFFRTGIIETCFYFFSENPQDV